MAIGRNYIAFSSGVGIGYVVQGHVNVSNAGANLDECTGIGGCGINTAVDGAESSCRSCDINCDRVCRARSAYCGVRSSVAGSDRELSLCTARVNVYVVKCNVSAVRNLKSPFRMRNLLVGKSRLLLCTLTLQLKIFNRKKGRKH